MKIKIHFHIAALWGWEEFVEQKEALMKKSGLWDAAHSIKFLMHYRNTDFHWMYNRFRDDPKVHCWPCGDSVPPLGEVYSQIQLSEDVEFEPEPVAILRYHTKGLTNRLNEQFRPNSLLWTEYFDYWNIEQWQLAYSKIQEGYDTVGANWHGLWDTPLKIPGHWSGNIWWANSEYLKKLPRLIKPHQADFANQLGGVSLRHDAELWIGVGKPKIYEMHHYEHVVVYHVPPPEPKNYRLDMINNN